MTLQEAYIQGVERVRQPQWACSTTYLKLDLLPDSLGPWGHLYDPEIQILIGEPTPQNILIIWDKYDKYEPYTGPIHYGYPNA